MMTLLNRIALAAALFFAAPFFTAHAVLAQDSAALLRKAAAGSPVLDLEVKEVQPNARVEIAVPENVRTATERVAAEKAAEGVWFLAGGSHNSVAIEMKDHVVLVEAPLGDARVAPVLAEVKKLIPGKPIRFVVNSHSHFDHSGGLRAAVAEGAAVITQQGSKAYFEKAFANPNRIAPDLLAKSGKKAKVIGVPAKQVLDDGARKVEVHHLRDPLHGRIVPAAELYATAGRKP